MDLFESCQPLWDRIRTERVTADLCVCRSPCYLVSVVISSDGNGEADATLIDGHNTGEAIKFDLYTADEEMTPLPLPLPAFFHKGLFVNIGTNVKSVVVQYIPLRE